MGYWVELHCDGPKPEDVRMACDTDAGDSPGVQVATVEGLRQVTPMLRSMAIESGWTRAGGGRFRCPACQSEFERLNPGYRRR